MQNNSKIKIEEALNSNKTPHMRITVEAEFEKHSATFYNMDVGLDQLFNSFIGLLVSATWDEGVIKDYLKDTYGEM